MWVGIAGGCSAVIAKLRGFRRFAVQPGGTKHHTDMIGRATIVEIMCRERNEMGREEMGLLWR